MPIVKVTEQDVLDVGSGQIKLLPAEDGSVWSLMKVRNTLRLHKTAEAGTLTRERTTQEGEASGTQPVVS